MEFKSAVLQSFVLSLVLLVHGGCTLRHSNELVRATGGSAALFGQFQAFDGHTGRALTFEQLASRAAAADIILFGEEHSDVVCNALEAQLLAALSNSPRGICLAMEFFEIDAQSPLDAYLAGRLDEPEFRKLTRQKKAYSMSHRPLIEYCRIRFIPVVAANAPWRLTRALRTSGKSYDEFRATTQPADRAILPRTSELLPGAYFDRYVEATRDHVMPGAPPAMQPSSQPTTSAAASPPTSQPDRAEQQLRGYRAQSLWDDTMAESVANERQYHPNRPVMLIVGRFHVAYDGGALVKLRRRRPTDRILTIVYRGQSEVPLKFDDSERNAGDIVIAGLTPPEEEPAPKPATTAPTSQPSSAPDTSTPSPTTSAADAAVTNSPDASLPARSDQFPAATTDPGPLGQTSVRPELMSVSEIRRELQRRVRADQAVRTADTPTAQEMSKVDQENTAWIKQVIERHGWPGRSLVGDNGAFAAWLLVQHADADPAFQAQCLELMKEAYEKGEVHGRELAYLTDRVLVNQGKEQRYGTQFWTPPFGRLQPRPIEDETRVDDRRAEMGLEPLAEYRKTMERQALGK
jgi:uncharacterized iron-regulated protein